MATNKLLLSALLLLSPALAAQDDVVPAVVTEDSPAFWIDKMSENIGKPAELFEPGPERAAGMEADGDVMASGHAQRLAPLAQDTFVAGHELPAPELRQCRRAEVHVGPAPV